MQFSIVFSENKLMEYVDSGKSLDDLICVQEDQLILEWFLLLISSTDHIMESHQVPEF